MRLPSRSITAFLENEQEGISQARVTILWVGGVGGIMAIALARSGVTNFIWLILMYIPQGFPLMRLGG